MKGKFYIFNAGCIRRGIDAIFIQKFFEANGYKITRWIRKADFIVVATCGVVALNEKSSLKAIKRAVLRKKQGAKVIVIGCLSKINPKAIDKLKPDYVIPTGSYDDFDNILDDLRMSIKNVQSPDSINDNVDIINYLIARSFCRLSKVYRFLFHKYSMNPYFLKISVGLYNLYRRFKSIFGSKFTKLEPYFNIRISDGCMSNCSFCATKAATGNLRSRPLADILEEFKAGLRKGYKVFQLVSEDTGCYGLDINSSLTDLLGEMFAVGDDFRLAIIDCCPQWLVQQREEMAPLLVRYQDKVQEIFIPIQSGSDKILRAMNRKYAIGSVIDLLKELQDRAPEIKLRITLLIGFPGETDEDFKATTDMLTKVNFAEITVNRYEDRPNTVSSTMSSKVSQEIKEERAKILEEQFNCKVLS